MAGILTPKAVLSFPNLFTPKPRTPNGDPVYSCSLLFDKEAQSSSKFKELKMACRDVFVEKFGEKALKGLESPFNDAGEKDYQGYEEGWVYINPWSNDQPGVYDRDREDVTSSKDVYAGQIVRAYVTPFAWDYAGRKGVSFGLNGVQIIVANAPRIDGRSDPKKAFNDGEVFDDEDVGASKAMADEDSPF